MQLYYSPSFRRVFSVSFRGCSHIISAKFGLFKTPLPPSSAMVIIYLIPPLLSSAIAIFWLTPPSPIRHPLSAFARPPV